MYFEHPLGKRVNFEFKFVYHSPLIHSLKKSVCVENLVAIFCGVGPIHVGIGSTPYSSKSNQRSMEFCNTYQSLLTETSCHCLYFLFIQVSTSMVFVQLVKGYSIQESESGTFQIGRGLLHTSPQPPNPELFGTNKITN